MGKLACGPAGNAVTCDRRRRLQKEEGLWDGKMPFAGQEEKVVRRWSMEVRGERALDTWIAQSLGTK